MLDIRFIRENPEKVAENCKNRNNKWDINEFLAVDEKRRAIIAEVEALKAERNAASKEIGAMMKAGQKEEAEAKKEAMRIVGDKIDALDKQQAEVDAQLTALAMSVPNMCSDKTPVGKDEDDNPEVRRWGTPREFDFEMKPHWDLGPELGIIDFERGVKLAHSRFSVLRGAGAKLEYALQSVKGGTTVIIGHARHRLSDLVNGRVPCPRIGVE